MVPCTCRNDASEMVEMINIRTWASLEIQIGWFGFALGSGLGSATVAAAAGRYGGGHGIVPSM